MSALPPDPFSTAVTRTMAPREKPPAASKVRGRAVAKGIDLVALRETYEAGASTVDLEIEHGISRTTIRKLLRKAGCNLRDVRQASRVRGAANWARLERPSPVQARVIVEDVFGARWRVTHASATEHGFGILRGVPDAKHDSSPAILLTAELAAHFERHRLAPRNLALPIGQTVINKLRRRLDQDWPRENTAWWLDRRDDLGRLSSKEFAQRHGVDKSTVTNARLRYCGKHPPRRDWSDPTLQALVLSDRPYGEIAEALGTSAHYVRSMRYLLRKKQQDAESV